MYQPVDPWRFRLIMVGVLAAALFLGWRALSIQVLDNDFLKDQGDARHLRVVSLPAHRGMILDRNGESLAVSTPVASVWANPQDLPLDDARIAKLAKLLDRPVSELKKDIRKRMSREFVYLKRHISPQLEQQVLALNLPGIAVQREYKRYYPTAEVTAQVLGFTNIDDQGQEGLELMFDDRLRGIPGSQRVVKDRFGHIVDSIDLIDSPVAGKNVQLSIDRRLQYVAYRELKRAVVQHQATSGSFVMLDARSGEVLALVNQPSFNPNNRASFSRDNTRNRAVTDLFEPGSTIKPFTVAAALRSRQFTVDSVIDTAPGYFRVGGSTISDFRNYGSIDVARIIQKSSNIGVSKMALAMPAETLWETFSDVGFGAEVTNMFPGEVQGRLPFYGEWKDVDQATIAFGYGLSVTPLQLAQAYTAFANKGEVKPVSFLRRKEIPEGRRVLDADYVASINRMMEAVVSAEGTARLADISGYRVAGKTGTVRIAGKGGYLDDHYRAVFAGLVPASDPRLVAVVVINDPRGEDYYGGKVAAPVFSKVMAAALRLKNIPPDDAGPQLRQASLRVAELSP